VSVRRVERVLSVLEARVNQIGSGAHGETASGWQSRSSPERWDAPSSRHFRALLSVCGRCSFGGLGCCSSRVRVCVGVGGVVLCRCVCV